MEINELTESKVLKVGLLNNFILLYVILIFLD
jgi:hypothetical protein